MNEYKVTFKATMSGFFLSKSAVEVKVYKAEDGQGAIKKAREHLERELVKEGLDPEEDGFTVEIVNIEKL